MAVHELRGLQYETLRDVYEPSDDTELLLEAIDPRPGETFLEIGTGAGLVGIEAARRGARVVATDLNPTALTLARTNAARNHVRIDLVRSDLGDGLRLGAFDAVAFNPPYLPTNLEERVPGPLNLAFEGGPNGRLVLDPFLRQINDDRPGRCWLLVSSLQTPSVGPATFRSIGYEARATRSKRLSFETLTAYELSDERSKKETK